MSSLTVSGAPELVVCSGASKLDCRQPEAAKFQILRGLHFPHQWDRHGGAGQVTILQAIALANNTVAFCSGHFVQQPRRDHMRSGAEKEVRLYRLPILIVRHVIDAQQPETAFSQKDYDLVRQRLVSIEFDERAFDIYMAKLG